MKKAVLTLFLLLGLYSIAQDSTAVKLSLKGQIFSLSTNGNITINEGGLTGSQVVDSLNSTLGNTDWQNGGGSYPSTANQYFVSEHSSKITMHDSLFNNATNYEAREFILTVNDTTELGDGVTSANYNKWAYIRGLGVDSTYLRAVDNDSILPAGSNTPIASGGLVFPNNETIAIRKRNGNIWDVLSIDGTTHIEQSYIYTIGDAVDPNYENNNINGIIGQSTPGSYSFATNNTVVLNGSYSIRVDRDVATGYPVIYHKTSNVSAGDQIRVRLNVFRPDDGISVNVQVKLDDDGEWTTQQVQNVGYLGWGQWTQVDLTATAAKDNPRIEIAHTAQNADAYYYYDNMILEKLN